MISKIAIVLEQTRGENNERLYQFVIPMGSPLEEVEQMAALMVEGAKEVCQKAKEQNEAMAAQAAAAQIPVDVVLPMEDELANS